MTNLSVDLSRKIDEMKKLMTGGGMPSMKTPGDQDEKKTRRMSNLVNNNVSAKNLLRSVVSRQMSKGTLDTAVVQSPTSSPEVVKPSAMTGQLTDSTSKRSSSSDDEVVVISD
jgi:hypothetical protein